MISAVYCITETECGELFMSVIVEYTEREINTSNMKACLKKDEYSG
jgi:hypothetical protein